MYIWKYLKLFCLDCFFLQEINFIWSGVWSPNCFPSTATLLRRGGILDILFLSIAAALHLQTIISTFYMTNYWQIIIGAIFAFYSSQTFYSTAIWKSQNHLYPYLINIWPCKSLSCVCVGSWKMGQGWCKWEGHMPVFIICLMSNYIAPTR